MKIAVFGATGGTGNLIVKQALAQGFEVKAFVRDPKKLQVSDSKIETIKGDILNSKTVEKGVSGADTVLVALGSDKPILAQGTANIISAMKTHNVKRIIIESSYSFSGSEEGIARLKEQGITDEQIKSFKPILDDKAAQEKETRESGLEFVIVRPLALTDGQKTGKFRAREKLDLNLESHISRADVADFMLKQVEDNNWLSKTVVLSY